MACQNGAFLFLLALPLGSATLSSEQSSFTEDEVPSVVGRMLKGQDVGGIDSNDLVFILGAVVALLIICVAVGVCYHHHRMANIDPYKETLWRYTHNEPMSIRSTPDFNGSKSSKLIMPNDVICVCLEFQAKDGFKYLKLADGSGWAPEQVPNVGDVVAQIKISSGDEALSGFQGSSSTWEFFLEWGWAKYDLSTSRMISAAESKGFAAVESIADSKYRVVIDLVSKQQINMVTCKRRPIRLYQSSTPAPHAQAAADQV